MATKKIQILDYNIKQSENSDTLDGKHASDFASASDMTTAKSNIGELQTKVGDKSVSSQISTAIASKADTGHTHTKSEVGLGNVDNTADADKSVKYATSAGSAASVTGIVGIEHGGTGVNNAVDARANLGAANNIVEHFASCYGATNQPTNDLLLIDINDNFGSSNYDMSFGTEDASTLKNSPVTSGAFYGYRKVYQIHTTNKYKTIIELHEAWPRRGRVWKREYDPNNGWSNHWSFSFTNNDTVPIANGGTGATTRGDALYNFIVGGVYSGEINNLIIAGTYWINLSNCKNGPSNSGYGTMEVTKSTSNNFLQRFTYYTGMVFYRTFTNGRWYDWRALPDAHTSETLWEGSLKTGTATITNGAKYAYLIVGGWAGNNEDAVTQIIPVGWGTHMRLTSADKWLAYQCDSSGSNASITILNNPSGGSIAWVWGVNRYKE